jgi:hypothetical protein
MKTLKNIASCYSMLLSFKGLGGVLFFFICSVGMGQTNLVLNGSFEDTAYCVSGPTQIQAASGWVSYADSPDYFNPCTSNSDVSVPNNWGGYQQPASGNAYCALATYFSGSFPNIREFMGSALSAPLSIGTKYFVSFKVNLSISSTIWVNCATNNIGAGFTTNPYQWSTNPLAVNNNPKVYSSSIITDTLNWVQIFGSFVADSAYQYIVLGNLFDDANTDTLIIDSGTSTSCNAYYFIDDVCVSTDSSFAANYIYTAIQEEPLKDNFNIYPNPVTDYFTIDNHLLNEPYDLIIYNTLGQKLYEEKNISTDTKTINVNHFTKGLLIINIKSKNQSINYKLLKP